MVPIKPFAMLTKLKTGVPQEGGQGIATHNPTIQLQMCYEHLFINPAMHSHCYVLINYRDNYHVVSLRKYTNISYSILERLTRFVWIIFRFGC